MRKKLLLIFLILSFAVLYGCGGYFGPGMADYSYKLSGDYKLFKAGSADIWSSDGMVQIIEGDIVGISWDDSFILAKQSKDKAINYWIIDVKSDKKYGPLSENDFESKKKELEVNNKLVLEKPEKYKNLDESLSKMK